MKIFFFTLGCKVNQYETVILKNIFLKNKFKISEDEKSADIFIINSCTVTSSSDKKINRLINKIKNIKQNAIIALTGCFPQAFPERYDFFNKVNIVTGNTNKFKLPDLLNKYLENKEKIVEIENSESYNTLENLHIEKVFKTPRAFIKIQDGCNKYCTYCIIPKARGILKSKPIEKIVLEAKNVSESGCCEAVLTGINLSCYGKDLKNVSLIDAVKAISNVEKIKRIRLSSLEPNLLKLEDFIFLKNEEKFCPQFHFSLQSGSDSTLKRMGRFYDKNSYKKTVELIFKLFKNPSITTDIIVGFPGETKEEFEETLNFVKEIGFFKVHIFPYSKRKGTKAAEMLYQISKEEKKQRAKILKKVAEETNFNFLKTQKGKTLKVLFETKYNETFTGYSENYSPVKVPCKHNICGKIRNVIIKEVEKNILKGEIIN